MVTLPPSVESVHFLQGYKKQQHCKVHPVVSEMVRRHVSPFFSPHEVKNLPVFVKENIAKAFVPEQRTTAAK